MESSPCDRPLQLCHYRTRMPPWQTRRGETGRTTTSVLKVCMYLLLDRESSSVTLVCTLPDQQFVSRLARIIKYGFRTPPGDPPQRAHAAALPCDEFGLRQERAFYGSDQHFTWRLLLCVIGAATSRHANRLHAAHAPRSDRRHSARDALYRARGARAERALW